MDNRTKIGEIVNVVGIKGEIKVYPLTNYYGDFEAGNEIYIENEKYVVEKMRIHKNTLVIKLKGLDDRNIAEALRNKFVETIMETSEELPDDTYLISTLKGMKVESLEGEYIGEISDVIQNPRQDVYEVTINEEKKVLIPAVKEFVKSIDKEKRIITIKVIEGLLEI